MNYKICDNKNFKTCRQTASAELQQGKSQNSFLVTIFLSFFLNSSEMEEKREVEVQSLKKGNFAFIRSQPCRITEVTKKPKASVKGNERIYIVGK